MGSIPPIPPARIEYVEITSLEDEHPRYMVREIDPVVDDGWEDLHQWYREQKDRELKNDRAKRETLARNAIGLCLIVAAVVVACIAAWRMV